jgi:hypothetical protein
MIRTESSYYLEIMHEERRGEHIVELAHQAAGRVGGVAIIPAGKTAPRLREDQIAKGFLGTHGNPRTCFGLGVSTDVPICMEGVLCIKVGIYYDPALWQRGDRATNTNLVLFGQRSRLYGASAIAWRAKCRFGTGNAISTVWPALVPEMQNPSGRCGSVP